MKVLLAADIHAGRRSSRIPDDVDRPRFSCAAAWQRMVDLAVRERVDLVAAAGDLIDRDNRYFEAFGPLEAGLKRLAEAGIPVAAVSHGKDLSAVVLGRFYDPYHFRQFFQVQTGEYFAQSLEVLSQTRGNLFIFHYFQS